MNIIKAREDLIVYVEESRLYKKPLTAKGRTEVETDWYFLNLLKDYGISPLPLSYKDESCVTFVENQPITDEELVYRSAVHLLKTLEKENVIHGDMTQPNIIINDNKVIVVDWGEAVFNKNKSKREGTDADYLWPTIAKLSPDTTRRIRRWVAVREHMRNYFNWGTFEDIGTYEGDFCAFASTEGMKATGIDRVWKRERIRHLWGGTMPFDYIQTDIIDHTMKQVEVRVMFSMWPYIVEEYGLSVAENVLSEAIETSSALFFETQYFGDGPGPSFLINDTDANAYLSRFGKAEKITTIPVYGRPHSRTIWKITNND